MSGNHYKRWSVLEEALLIEFFKNKAVTQLRLRQLGRTLGRSASAVQSKLYSLRKNKHYE